MNLPKCVIRYILSIANWFPARRVNRTFRQLVDSVYKFKRNNINIICEKSTPAIVELYKKQYRVVYNELLKKTVNNSVEMVVYFIDNGANCFGYLFRSKINKVVEIGLSKGVTNWNDGMASASKFGNQQLVELMIEKGATNCEFCKNTKHIYK